METIAQFLPPTGPYVSPFYFRPDGWYFRDTAEYCYQTAKRIVDERVAGGFNYVEDAPALYLFRHYLELALKEVLVLQARYLAQFEDDPPTLPCANDPRLGTEVRGNPAESPQPLLVGRGLGLSQCGARRRASPRQRPDAPVWKHQPDRGGTGSNEGLRAKRTVR